MPSVVQILAEARDRLYDAIDEAADPQAAMMAFAKAGNAVDRAVAAAKNVGLKKPLLGALPSIAKAYEIIALGPPTKKRIDRAYDHLVDAHSAVSMVIQGIVKDPRKHGAAVDLANAIENLQVRMLKVRRTA